MERRREVRCRHRRRIGRLLVAGETPREQGFFRTHRTGPLPSGCSYTTHANGRHPALDTRGRSTDTAGGWDSSSPWRSSWALSTPPIRSWPAASSSRTNTPNSTNNRSRFSLENGVVYRRKSHKWPDGAVASLDHLLVGRRTSPGRPAVRTGRRRLARSPATIRQQYGGSNRIGDWTSRWSCRSTMRRSRSPERTAWIDRSAKRHSYEIVFVDDSSTDGSWETLERLKRTLCALRSVIRSHNFSKSAALYCRFAAAEAAVIRWTLETCRTRPNEIPDIAHDLERGLRHELSRMETPNVTARSANAGRANSSTGRRAGSPASNSTISTAG